MVMTVCRFELRPFFRLMVTGPEAPDHLSSKGLPASMTNWELVNEALALTTAARAATKNVESFMVVGDLEMRY